MRKHLRQKTALTLCLLFIAFVLLSACYLVKEADHVCAGEHCSICQTMAVCAKLLRAAAFTGAAVAFAALFAVSGELVPRLSLAPLCPKTPVSLRVKLSN